MKKLNLNTMFAIAAVLLILAGVTALLSNYVPAIRTAEGVTDISS